ncbi:hypothetical protein WJX72_001968 [[Myrmecia] bisecta]|uniref:Uncharacterized protein n=1 Tax=[Myrmecia] bisecta TaxID=41462 RepID=A0AAW1R563_9CHLO
MLQAKIEMRERLAHRAMQKPKEAQDMQAGETDKKLEEQPLLEVNFRQRRQVHTIDEEACVDTSRSDARAINVSESDDEVYEEVPFTGDAGPSNVWDTVSKDDIKEGL